MNFCVARFRVGWRDVVTSAFYHRRTEKITGLQVAIVSKFFKGKTFRQAVRYDLQNRCDSVFFFLSCQKRTDIERIPRANVGTIIKTIKHENIFTSNELDLQIHPTRLPRRHDATSSL